jgi:peptidoglycan/LPS O-acetylase OafA/YrhL
LFLDGAATLSVDRQSRIPELDGWRAVSIALVIASHLSVFRFHQHLASHPRLARECDYLGSLGVKIFFVISGFVICRLMLSEEARYGFVSFRGFYLRRALRILPPLYLMLATLALFIAAGWIQCSWKNLALGGLFMANLNFAGSSWFTGHTWSLSVEEQFYLLFPLLWFLTRARSSWRGPFFASLFVALAAWNGIARALLDPNRLQDERFFSVSRVGFSCICAGVLLAIWEGRARQIAMRIPGWAVLLLGLVLLVNPVHRDTVSEAITQSFFVPPAIALVLIHSVATQGKRLRAILCSRPMQAVGLTSYGIYLWQELFAGKPEYYIGAGAALSYLFPLLLAIVPLSYFLVERPAMRLAKSLSNRIRARAAIPV